MTMLLVSVMLCGGTGDDKKAEEKAVLEALKPLLTRIEKEGTAIVVSDFVQPGRWMKRHYKATDVQFDVTRTDSIVTPYKTRVTWLNAAYVTPFFKSEAEARQAQLPDKPRVSGTVRHWAELAYRDGRWVPVDLGWRMPEPRIDKRHSTSTDPKDPIHDWWAVFSKQ
jgi:hypothetical protein